MKNIKIFKSELKPIFGRLWLIFLLKSKILSRKLHYNTKWAKKINPESQFVKRLSIASAIYIGLQKKFNNQKAFEIIKNIIIPLGLDEMYRLIPNLEENDPQEKLIEFFVSIRLNGVGKFVKRNLIKANNNSLEYEVRDCIFVRFFKETGTPELAKLFCEVDTIFFPKAFPEFKFSRGDSFENTQAYGNECCIFNFNRIEDVVVE